MNEKENQNEQTINIEDHENHENPSDCVDDQDLIINTNQLNPESQLTEPENVDISINEVK